MKIVEYRIFVPMRIEQCRAAVVYSVSRRMEQETGNGEGFEILENDSFMEGDIEGHHVHRVVHFKSRVPSAISWVIPERYAHVHEHNYDAFPHVWGDWYCAGMGDDMILKTETRYIELGPNRELPENPMGMEQEFLDQRKIYYLDILDGPSDKKEFDLHGFSCPEAGIQEIHSEAQPDDSKIPDWVNHYDGPLVLVVKYLKFMFRWRGLQTTVEALVGNNVFYYTYLDTYKALIKWAPEWSKMSTEELFLSTEKLKEVGDSIGFEKEQ